MQVEVTLEQFSKQVGWDLQIYSESANTLNGNLHKLFIANNRALKFNQVGEWISEVATNHCIKPWEHVANSYFKDIFGFNQEHFYIDIEESIKKYQYEGYFDIGLVVWKFNHHLYRHQINKVLSEPVEFGDIDTPALLTTHTNNPEAIINNWTKNFEEVAEVEVAEVTVAEVTTKEATSVEVKNRLQSDEEFRVEEGMLNFDGIKPTLDLPTV